LSYYFYEWMQQQNWKFLFGKNFSWVILIYEILIGLVESSASAIVSLLINILFLIFLLWHEFLCFQYESGPSSRSLCLSSSFSSLVHSDSIDPSIVSSHLQLFSLCSETSFPFSWAGISYPPFVLSFESLHLASSHHSNLLDWFLFGTV